MNCTICLRLLHHATRSALDLLLPSAAVTPYHSTSARVVRRGFKTSGGNMANLKKEFPDLKLNDGTSIPMVRILGLVDSLCT